MFTNSRFCYECSKKLSSSTEHAIILSSILKRSLLHHQWISTTVVHRQRPKHAQKLHRPAVFLDESDDGARSFETKTTLTVLNSTSFFLESGQTIVRKLKTCIYVWKFLTILCHFTNNVFLSNFHCFCSFPCQNLDFFNSLQLMYRNLPR